jgi:hypothetical protein
VTGNALDNDAIRAIAAAASLAGANTDTTYEYERAPLPEAASAVEGV